MACLRSVVKLSDLGRQVLLAGYLVGRDASVEGLLRIALSPMKQML
jgi:hypothetical protein